MAKLLKSNLCEKTDVCSYLFNVKSGITVVAGNGASGKTLLYSIRSGRKGAGIKSYNNEYFINAQSLRNMGITFESFIKQHKNAVVWVDNADIVVPRTTKIKDLIAKSDCQFIFLGRDTSRYTYDYSDLAMLTEVQSKQYVLQYAFPEGASQWG